MVERTNSLDLLFGCLSSRPRRDILQRVSAGSMSIGDIAKHYQFSFAATAKHINVLEHAGLVFKTRKGKEQIVSLKPQTLSAASDYIEQYRRLWEGRLDSLDEYLRDN